MLQPGVEGALEGESEGEVDGNGDDGDAEGDAEGVADGVVEGMTVGGWGKQKSLRHSSEMQSEFDKHPDPFSHRGHSSPPQSTSVSPSSFLSLLHSTVDGDEEGEYEGVKEGEVVGNLYASQT